MSGTGCYILGLQHHDNLLTMLLDQYPGTQDSRHPGSQMTPCHTITSTPSHDVFSSGAIGNPSRTCVYAQPGIATPTSQLPTRRAQPGSTAGKHGNPSGSRRHGTVVGVWVTSADGRNR